MSNFDDIQNAAKRLRAQRDQLDERASAMHQKIEQVKAVHLRGLRNSVAAVAETQANLLAAVGDAPQLFSKPRSIVLHGIKLGFEKGKGKIDFENEDQVCKLVRKHFPDQFDVLVKTTEKPVKTALATLSAAELKRLGVTVESTGDVAFAKDTTSEVDKLVKALLKGIDDEVAA